MSQTGYSVFAPYARVAPTRVPGLLERRDGAKPVLVATNTPEPCRDHRHGITLHTLHTLPQTLVRRDKPEVAHEPDDPSQRRTRIWEFSQNLHCSIIGTCLSTADLRQILGRIGLAQPDQTDHELHHTAVSLAAKHDQAAKLLHKALDRRHKLAIARFARAKTEAELGALWRDALKQGDIPGAYWAVLTHHATTQALVRHAFGEVHMLSHLVGSANRADIRHLREMEERKAELEEKLKRQEESFHHAVVTRDATIRALRDTLRDTTHTEPRGDEDTAALRVLAADLEKRWNAEAQRRVAVEERLTSMRDALAQATAARTALETENAALRAELAAMERAEEPAQDDLPVRLDGLTVLYVGGRPNQIPFIRSFAEDRGAAFAHHDGGIEHHLDLLSGLASRADVVLFPVDCISHEAAWAVKRLCQQNGTRFMPLRSAGTASFIAAINGLRPAQAA